MKKALSALCALLLTACALCSCSSEGGEPVRELLSADISYELSAEETSEETAEESSNVRISDISLPEISKEDLEQKYPIGYDPQAEPVYLPGESFVYVALGDSIASGYALNDPKRKCYGALFAAMCGSGCDYRNYAVKGHETGDLLRVLRGIDISDADLVTVSIGGNNVLNAAAERFFLFFADFGVGIFAEYAKTLVGLGDKDRVDRFFAALREALDDDLLRAQVKKGIEKTKTELPAVLKTLREKAPHAFIVIQTVYNPYKGMSIDIPGIFHKDVSALLDEFVRSLNRVITVTAEEYGCEVLDVYTEFERSSKDLLNAQTEFAIGKPIDLDPHPNAYGHELIARMLKIKWNSLVHANEK